MIPNLSMTSFNYSFAAFVASVIYIDIRKLQHLRHPLLLFLFTNVYFMTAQIRERGLVVTSSCSVYPIQQMSVRSSVITSVINSRRCAFTNSVAICGDTSPLPSPNFESVSPLLSPSHNLRLHTMYSL